jgi:pyruvate/2-oxoglutarate/acetoin dehydrogenase E1 component
MDFMMLAVDPIVNQAANWSYVFCGRVPVPIVIRSVIARGGEQGAQHSQAVHAFYMHVPGLKVVMPSTPYDAKGLLIAASRDNNPIMYIDERWLYEETGDVPSEMYEVPIGKATIRSVGTDVTIVGSSFMAREAVKAGEILRTKGVSAEVIDLRSLKPWDEEAVLRSVRKTGRLVVADSGWLTAGAAAEVAATVSSKAFDHLRAPIERVCLPDCPAPVSATQERAYYRSAEDIVIAAERACAHKRAAASAAIG